MAKMTYAKIADHLFMTPKTIMRDIKCLAIKSHCSKKYKFYSSKIDALQQEYKFYLSKIYVLYEKYIFS